MTKNLLSVRACWVSDLHLGSRRRCKPVRKTLQSLDPTTLEYLVLLGDVFEPRAPHALTIAKTQGYVTHFTRDVTQLAAQLFEKFGEARVRLHEGNHDPFTLLWPWLDEAYPAAAALLKASVAVGHIRLVAMDDTCVHTTATGLKLWETHGHKLDMFYKVGQSFSETDGKGARWTKLLPPYVKRGIKNLSVNTTYAVLAWLSNATPVSRYNTSYPWLRRGGSWFKILVRRFHHKMVDYAHTELGLDGVMCGHTHVPWIRQYKNGLYVNCGESVDTQHGTFLVEKQDCALLVLPHSSKIRLPFFQRWGLRVLGIRQKLKRKRVRVAVAAWPLALKGQTVAALFPSYASSIKEQPPF